MRSVWFLIVPWFFMDLSQAEKEEINAYRQRYNTLTILETEKQCAATTIAKADELEEAEAGRSVAVMGCTGPFESKDVSWGIARRRATL